jgi:uncharacterized protein involved in cysteine biosynthesis
MGPYGVMIIISILIWVVTIFLFKNSYDDWQWGKSNKIWLEKDRLTAPLWAYILVIISIFIPVLNVVIAPLALIILLIGYSSEDIYLHIELPEKLKFLTKEY